MLKKYDDQRFRDMIFSCLLLSADNETKYTKLKNVCADICYTIYTNIPQNKENLQILFDHTCPRFSIDICKEDTATLYGVDIMESHRGVLCARIRNAENVVIRFIYV